MFVRWQQYRSQALDDWQRKRNDRRARLKAILVESVRINGRPTQKHVAFLGSVIVDDVDDGVGLTRFWYDVTRRLNGLRDRMSPDQRKRIEASLAKRVNGRLLTKAELNAFERQREETLRRLKAI